VKVRCREPIHISSRITGQASIRKASLFKGRDQPPEGATGFLRDRSAVHVVLQQYRAGCGRAE